MSDVITTRQTWPATDGAEPVYRPGETSSIDAPGPKADAGGTITGYAVLPYPSMFGPVLIPGEVLSETPAPDTEAWLEFAINKWSPRWTQPYLESNLHPSLIPATSAWSTYTPPPDTGGFSTYPNQVYRKENVAYLAKTTRDNTPFAISITPDMWMARYPTNPIVKQVYPVSRIFEPPAIIFPPFLRPVRPDIIWRHEPTYYRDPSWFGPDQPRPNQPTEVEAYFVW